jgi:hypothetical protein
MKMVRDLEIFENEKHKILENLNEAEENLN